MNCMWSRKQIQRPIQQRIKCIIRIISMGTFILQGAISATADIVASNISVRNFHVNQLYFPFVIGRLRHVSGVAICIESIPPEIGQKGVWTKVSLHIDSGTVGEILDKIVACDSRYIWIDCGNSVINIVPRNDFKPKNNGLDVLIQNYRITSKNVFDAVNTLFKTEELKNPLLTPIDLGSLPSDVPEDTCVFEIRDMTTRQVLNEIIKCYRNYVWDFVGNTQERYLYIFPMKKK